MDEEKTFEEELAELEDLLAELPSPDPMRPVKCEGTDKSFFGSLFRALGLTPTLH